MKKNVLIVTMVVLLLCITTGFAFHLKYLGWSDNVREAFSQSHAESLSVIWDKQTDDGRIVLYQQFEHEDLSLAFVREEFGYYQVLYSGVLGDAEVMSSRWGFAFLFLPSVNDMFFPVYAGTIAESDIAKIKVTGKDNGTVKEANIINTETNRVWFLDMGGLDDLNVLISGYSDSGDELFTKEDRISVYHLTGTLNRS